MLDYLIKNKRLKVLGKLTTFLLSVIAVSTLALFIVFSVRDFIREGSAGFYEEIESSKDTIKLLKVQMEELKRQEAEDMALGQFVLSLMNEVNANLSPMRKILVAQTVVRVTNNIFDKKEQKYNFAVLLAIESKFNNTAVSPVGAAGISQVMPQYAKEFATKCGINDYKPDDLKDIELNMTIGACQFNALLQSEKIKGVVAAALVAYNAGINSTSFKSLVGLRNIENVESASYVTKFQFLREKASSRQVSSEE